MKEEAEKPLTGLSPFGRGDRKHPSYPGLDESGLLQLRLPQQFLHLLDLQHVHADTERDRGAVRGLASAAKGGGGAGMEAEPGRVVRRAGGVVPGGDAGVHAVRALQAQGVVGPLAGRRRLVVQDGVVEQRRGGAATRHRRGKGGRRGRQLALRAAERLPLALGLGHRPLLQLGQAAPLLLDHLLAWASKGESERERSTGRDGDPNVLPSR